MENTRLQGLAQLLDKAVREAKPIRQLSITEKFTEAEAYLIQNHSLKIRYERGEKLIGLKLGFTSKAKMEQMGVHDMIWGQLTNSMLFEQGGTLGLSRFIHPRAEPELCFRISKDIVRPIALTEVKEYVDAIAPAIEIIDSRYKDFKFSLEDVIADNCSSAALVVGEWVMDIPDLSNIGISLKVNDEVVQKGTSAAILGNPWESVVAAARLAIGGNLKIPKGSIIMAGAATSAVYISSGQKIEAQVEGLGTALFSVE